MQPHHIDSATTFGQPSEFERNIKKCEFLRTSMTLELSTLPKNVTWLLIFKFKQYSCNNFFSGPSPQKVRCALTLLSIIYFKTSIAVLGFLLALIVPTKTRLIDFKISGLLKLIFNLFE